MSAESITLEGAIVLEGGDRHRHAARRLRESFPGIAWQDGGAGAVITLEEDGRFAEGAFRIVAEPPSGSASRAVPSPASSTGPRSSSLAGDRIRDASRSRSLHLAGARPGLPHLLDLGPLDQLGALPGGPAGDRRLQPLRQAARRLPAGLPALRRLLLAGIASRPSSSTASCATRTAASRLRRSCAATPPSAACASCRASPSAPTVAATGRATTASTWPPG